MLPIDDMRRYFLPVLRSMKHALRAMISRRIVARAKHTTPQLNAKAKRSRRMISSFIIAYTPHICPVPVRSRLFGDTFVYLSSIEVEWRETAHLSFE